MRTHGPRAQAPPAVPLTHTVFLVPVKLVPRVTLALVAAGCVHTDLLAASIVDAAFIGICGTKNRPLSHSIPATHWPQLSP